jgi:DHA2 family multidrug resistance protein-like MFS transporter
VTDNSGEARLAGRREWIGLAVLALPTLLTSIDVFVILLALPRMSVALHATSTQQLWALDIYGFMVAGFLVTMGSLGDRIGRRRLLFIGAAAFGIASVLTAFSTSAPMLIGARALLGVAGATVAPSTLALISNMFHDARQRGTAIGIWAGCFVAGAIVGPVLGGVMLEHFWWGSVFLLGVPAMVLLLVLGPSLLPEYRSPQRGRLDLVSVALSLAAILPTIYGLKGLAREGWQIFPAVTIVVGLAMGVAFVRRQNRLGDPLLDLRLFNSRAFSTTLGSMLSYAMLSGGTMVFVAQYLQLVAHLSPLWAGLAMVPGMLAAIAGFQIAPIMARRTRPGYLFAGGLVIAVAGLLLLTQADATSGIAYMVVGFVLMSVGGAPLVSLGTGLVIGSAPPERAGSAAAVAQTSNQVGYALGIAVLGSIGTAIYRVQMADSFPTGVPAVTASAARDSLASATSAARGIPEQLANVVLTMARNAFVSELHAVAVVSAAFLTVVAALCMTLLRHVSPLAAGSKSAEPIDEPSAARPLSTGRVAVIEESV